MKILLVGPGIMDIPPRGWGAVEQLIWDNYRDFQSCPGIEVDICNVPDRFAIVKQANKGYDAVHIHYDVFHDILDCIAAPVKIISSHYPYLNMKDKWAYDGYESTFRGIVHSFDTNVFVSSMNDAQTFMTGGVNKDRLFISKLGIRSEDYNYTDSPQRASRTLCLGKITPRKGQAPIQDILDIDFVGKLDDEAFSPLRKNYLGEMPRKELNEIITEYGNIILLTKGENATPLVIKEGLICGLGAVVSESAAIELNREQPWITVIPNEKLEDVEYIRQAIYTNRQVSLYHRDVIRQYALAEFDSLPLAKEYLDKVKSLL